MFSYCYLYLQLIVTLSKHTDDLDPGTDDLFRYRTSQISWNTYERTNFHMIMNRTNNFCGVQEQEVFRSTWTRQPHILQLSCSSSDGSVLERHGKISPYMLLFGFYARYLCSRAHFGRDPIKIMESHEYDQLWIKEFQRATIFMIKILSTLRYVRLL